MKVNLLLAISVLPLLPLAPADRCFHSELCLTGDVGRRGIWGTYGSKWSCSFPGTRGRSTYSVGWFRVINHLWITHG